MTTFTKHILEANRKIYKKDFTFPEDATPPPDVEISLPKISISNDNMVFSLSVEHILSIMLKDGSPVYVSDASDLINLKLLSVHDKDLIEMLKNSAGNIDNFLDIVDKNSQKIQQINIPYDNRGILQKDKILSTSESNFTPISLRGKDEPDDLSLFYMLILENGTRRSLISQVNKQDIISSGKVIPSSNILDRRTRKLDGYLNFEIINQVKENKEAYFSDQFMSLDPSGFIKFLFMFDKIQFLQEKSLFGGVLKGGTTDAAMKSIIEKSQITDLRIIKSRVKKNIDGFSKFSKNQKYEVVISSSDDDTGNLLYREKINTKNSKIQGKIVELPGIKNSQKFKTYAVNDYSPLKIKNGQYRYSISMRIRDGVLLYLLDSVAILTKAKKDLLVYQKQQASPSLEIMNQTKKSVEDILSILFSMKQMSESEKQATMGDFEIMFGFFEGRQNIIDFASRLMDKINYALSTRGLSNLNSKSASYTKNTNNLFFIEYSQKFNKIVDFSELIGEKTHFIEKINSEDIGATIYSESIIKDRFMKEFKKIMNFTGDYEEINFPTLTAELVEGARNANLEQGVVSTIFDFKNSFYSYLSPLVTVDEDKKIKNTNFSLNSYNPSDNTSLNTLSEQMTKIGVRILTPVEVEQKTQSRNSRAICSDKIFGQQNIINTEKTYNGNSETSSKERSKQHYRTKRESYPFSNGVKKYYNNFNLERQNYNLSSPSNMIISKINQENKEMIVSELENMPNQIRSLFINDSDIVKNKWNLTEIDFFANPMSNEMMRENYSNLVKVEILNDFVKDSSNMKNIKSPSFKPLEITDIKNLKSGESLLCRSQIINDYSLGIGQRQKSKKEPIYYNKYFILTGDRN